MTSKTPVLTTVYPQGTMAVSVTGRSCSLNCAHCGGHYLNHMVDVRDLSREMAKKKPLSILLSGGCSLDGAVPLASTIKRLREEYGDGLRINAHPGVAKEEDASAIARHASVISFDFVLDDEAIREAFRGNWTKEDYLRTYRTLRSGRAPVVPHVLVGLKRGVIAKEYEAVDYLLAEGAKRIIFIVLIPTRGTEWENVRPPLPEDVAKLLSWTRAKAPSLGMALGCMRPSGKYRKSLDVLAVRAGIDRIVLPHPDAVKEAASMGMKIERKGECCSFE